MTSTTGTFSGVLTADSLNLTNALSIANGGTGATTAPNALTNLGAVAKAGDTMTGTLIGTDAKYSGVITGREINTNYRQTMSRSDAYPTYITMNRIDQKDGIMPLDITQVGYIQANLTTSDDSPYGRSLGALSFNYDTTGGGRTTLSARNVSGNNSSMIELDADESLATITGAVQVNSTLTTSGSITRAGSGTLSFLANRTNSDVNSYYGAQTTAGTVYFGTGSGTNFVVNNAQSNSLAWLNMDASNAQFLTKVTVPSISTQTISDLSGSLTLGADAVSAYDAVTLRQLQAATGSGTATINGVMNNFLGAVEWFLGTRAAMPGGHLACDGQLLSRTTYADLWAAVSSGMFISVSESTWQSSPSHRGKFSTGDGSTTFRLPDLNGTQSGSIASTFLRGNAGTTSAIAMHGDTGTAATSGAPNINGQFTATMDGFAHLPFGSYSNAFTPIETVGNALASLTSGTYTNGSHTRGAVFNASNSNSLYGGSPNEIRPAAVVGVWVMRVNGLFSAANTNFNVITADTALPSSGTVAYGGDLRSVYRVAGANNTVAQLRAKNVVGTGQYASIMVEGGSGELTISNTGSVKAPSFRCLGGVNGIADANETYIFDWLVSDGNLTLNRNSSGSVNWNSTPHRNIGDLSFVNTASLYATLSNMGFTSGGTNQFRVMTSSGRQFHIQCNSAVITLNSSGEGTISYPSTFTTQCMICIPVLGDNTGGTSVRIINYSTARTTNFDIHVDNQVSSACRINFIAIGY